eukprot:16118897-Heterocapsa_arctica.AAC.1
MCERNPNADRARGSCQFICKSGENQWKQNGKRTLAMNQHKFRNFSKSNADRNTRGSNSGSRDYCDGHTKRSDGGGCIRSRQTTWNTDDLERSDSGEQLHRARQFRDTDHRHGDENQSGRFGDRSRVCKMLPAQ